MIESNSYGKNTITDKVQKEKNADSDNNSNSDDSEKEDKVVNKNMESYEYRHGILPYTDSEARRQRNENIDLKVN